MSNYIPSFPFDLDVEDTMLEECEKCGTENVAVMCEDENGTHIVRVCDWHTAAWTIMIDVWKFPQKIFYVLPA